MVNNQYLDKDGYVDISNSPITISLLNVAGIDPSSVECWNAYCGSEHVYSKDKTIENCWKKYAMIFPNGWNIHRNNLGVNENIEWLTPLKFRVKRIPTEGITLSTNDPQLDGAYAFVSYKAFKVRVSGMPSMIHAKVERIFTNITTNENVSVDLENGITSIDPFSKTVYRKNSSSKISATEA